jgi:hypothetical protein
MGNLKFVAYNKSTSHFELGEVEFKDNIPEYFWENGLVTSDDDFSEWNIWIVGIPFKIEVISTYKFSDTN